MTRWLISTSCDCITLPMHYLTACFAGFKKSFRDTRKVFLGSLHVVSACHLPLKWTPCKGLDPDSGLCWGMGYSYGRKDQYPTDSGDFYFNHRVDESVFDGDFRTVDREAEAVLYHIQIHRTKLRSGIEEIERYRDHPSRYATHFFPAVVQALDRRNLLMPMTVTYNLDNPPPPPPLTNSSLSVRKHTSTLPLRTSGDRSALYLASFIEVIAAGFTLVTMLYRDQDAPSSNSSRRYSCHIRHTSTSKAYSVSAELILGSPVDLIRCPLSAEAPASAVDMWVQSDEYMAVTIFVGEVESMSFEVPWYTRINSKLWQPATGSLIGVMSPPEQGRLVSIVSSSRIDLASYLQHVQESTNAGIDHVYLLTDRPPHSNHVAHLARVLQSYIAAGSLSIISSDARATSLPPLMHGFLRTAVAAMYLKGSCSHILLTDTEEFLVPRKAGGLKVSLAVYTASQSAFFRHPGVNEANTCVYGLIRRVVMLADMQEKPWIRDKLEYMRQAVVKEHLHAAPLIAAASLVNIHYHPVAVFSFQCASSHLLPRRDSTCCGRSRLSIHVPSARSSQGPGQAQGNHL